MSVKSRFSQRNLQILVPPGAPDTPTAPENTPLEFNHEKNEHSSISFTTTEEELEPYTPNPTPMTNFYSDTYDLITKKLDLGNSKSNSNPKNKPSHKKHSIVVPTTALSPLTPYTSNPNKYSFNNFKKVTDLKWLGCNKLSDIISLYQAKIMISCIRDKNISNITNDDIGVKYLANKSVKTVKKLFQSLEQDPNRDFILYKIYKGKDKTPLKQKNPMEISTKKNYGYNVPIIKIKKRFSKISNKEIIDSPTPLGHNWELTDIEESLEFDNTFTPYLTPKDLETPIQYGYTPSSTTGSYKDYRKSDDMICEGNKRKHDFI